MKIIGLGHYSRTGKDTFANALIENLRQRAPHLRVGKIPFAWKLKDICHQLYGWDGMREAEFYDTPEGEKFRNIPLPTIGKTPVEIWIDVGTPAMREQVYMGTWIDYLLKTQHDLDVLVIPDVRFPNEVAAVREAGGILNKVVRPGYGPRPSPADRALLCYRGWDYVIGSSGLKSDLLRWAEFYARWLTGGDPIIQTEAEKNKAYLAERIDRWERDHEWLQPGWTLTDDGRLLAGEPWPIAA